MIIQAVLKNKSLGCEYTEDILTSTIFGALRYIDKNKALIPFIESAFACSTNKTLFWNEMESKNIELRCYKDIEYVFWARHRCYGEPDLMLIFSGHVHKKEDFLLLIENKFKSGKSGVDEDDQLAKYFESVKGKNIEQFLDSRISKFKGQTGYVIYLTETEASADILASNDRVKKNGNETENPFFHLKWNQLYKIMGEQYEFYDFTEKKIVNDLLLLMKKLGLDYFAGITLPCESLSELAASNQTVFFREEILNGK